MAKKLGGNEKMIPKERVLAAFNHNEPDRVPINYFANPGIEARLLKYFGLKSNDREGLRQALGADFRGVMPKYKGPRLHAEIPGRNVDSQWGIRTRYIEHESGSYWDYCDFPLRDADEEQVLAWPMPSPDDFDYEETIDMCKKHEKYAICIGHPGIADIINTNGMIRGMEQTLVDLATDEPAGLLLIKRRLEIQLEIIRRTLEVAKGRIDFMWIGEDLGTQHAPMVSLDLYRKHIRPYHQKFIDLAKTYNLPVMIHSCGSSSWAFDDFIEMGIDIVDTLQPEAKDMSPAYLKERYGEKLAFHGCISTAGPVAYGTVDDVITNIKETLGIMMPGGGYCFAPTHSLQDNSPTENVIVMYEMAHKLGQY